jgi:hypothetical protein
MPSSGGYTFLVSYSSVVCVSSGCGLWFARCSHLLRNSAAGGYTHQNCVRVVPPEDGQVMPKHVEALSFNKLKVNVKCIKLVRVVKLYRDARSAKHSIAVVVCTARLREAEATSNVTT